jgi:hypothetical protein
VPLVPLSYSLSLSLVTVTVTVYMTSGRLIVFSHSRKIMNYQQSLREGNYTLTSRDVYVIF